MQSHTPYCIQHRSHQWVLGLEWRYLPVRGRRKIRQRLPRGENLYQVSLPQENGGEQGCLLGTTMLNAANKRREKSYPLALAVLQQLPADTFVVCSIDANCYWFVARVGETLSPFSDYLGSAEEIRRHIRHFRMLSPPEIAWHEYRGNSGSDDELIAGAVTLDLLLLQCPPLSRKYRLRPVAHHRHLRLSAVLILLAALGVSAWLWWNNYQQQQRIAAAQRYLLQQQQLLASHQGLRPWRLQPALAETLSRCQQQTETLPLFIAGWGLMHVQCSPRSNKLVVSYRMQSEDTIDHFIRQLSRDHLPVIRQHFNLPGPGDEAILQLRIPESAIRADDSPPGISLNDWVSLAQRTHSELQLSDVLRVPGSDHYRLHTFTFVTALSPRLMLSDPAISSANLVADSLEIQRSGGKLLMTLEGRIYEHQ